MRLSNTQDVATFVNVLFRHANPDGFISLRAFHEKDRGKPPLFTEGIRLGDPKLVERICARINEAANHPEPYVFCPPLCTFKNANHARMEDIAEGVCLSVECDQNAVAAYNKLTQILGTKATAAVCSGGLWHNPETGKDEPKAHIHWRLAEPTRDEESHEMLREARDLAARLIGSDVSAVPMVHPLRWPGSWHRKGDPIQATLRVQSGCRILLGEALVRLRAACADLDKQAKPSDTPRVEWSAREEDRVRDALKYIPAEDRVVWRNVGMALHHTDWPPARNIWDEWARTCPTKYDEGGQDKAWNSFHMPKSRPPVTLGTLFALAKERGWQPTISKDEDAIAALARLGVMDYQRRRGPEAKHLGISVAALDKLVRQTRAQAEEEDSALPHWQVEPWPEPVDGAALLSDIERVFRRYIYLPIGAPAALPLWTLHAWTMDAGDISPFVALVSPTKRCGKTSVLIILLYLTPRSELASNISSSALFRYVEEIRPTLLIDEADSFAKDDEEMRGILNSGHTKAAAHVIRNVEVNGEHKPRRFSTWAPKAIATIRSLADTLEDRAVVVTLQRKPRGATVARLRKRDNSEFAELRGKALRWANDNSGRLVDPEPSIPDALNDRAADNWRPLLAIADLAGGDWPAKAREAALVLSGDEVSSLNIELLTDIRKAFGNLECIASADLVEALVADPERPWATCGKNGKPLTQNHLARLLRSFRIISETVHPAGRADAKGYKRAHFEEVWEGYLPGQNPSSQPNPDFKASNRPNADGSSTSRDFQSVQKDNPDASKKANLSHSHAGLDTWTLRKAENGAKGDSATNGGRIPNDFDAVAEELAERGSNGPVYAEVRIRTITPPAIAAGPGDDLLDIDPGWQQ